MESLINGTELGAINVLEQALMQLRLSPKITGSETLRSNYHLARTMYRERRAREEIFGCGVVLFGEPAWDMLLDLYVAGAEGKRVSVSSACIAAAVPTTTALRWIDSLKRRGFVDRTNDPVDRRRSFLSLSEKGTKAMELFFQARAKL